MRGDEEQDKLLMSLVESIIELPPAERETRLRALSDDPELSEEVRTRIVWEERMGRFLLDPVIQQPAVAETLGPGHKLGGRFHIVREVGHGGMGIVYEAVDEELDRRVALKCAKPGHSRHLPPEARAAREVSHFNVCKVHDLHRVSTEFGEMEFLSMEFIEGETLSARIDRDGRVPEREAHEIASQICGGLAQAHRQGVIHGDLKCSNIILARAPEGGMRAVITDFGLAQMKFAEASRLLSPHGGTFDYMAPELFCGGAATVATDLYAVGVLFHTMLTGEAPKRLHSSLARGIVETWKTGPQVSTVILESTINDADWGRKVAALPSRWKRIVTRCLAAQPADRFASTEDLTRALTRWPSWVKWAAAGAAAAVLTGGWLASAANQGDHLDNVVQLTSATDLSGAPSLSRDGKTIAYESDGGESGNLDIWVQQLPAGPARRLTTRRAETHDPSVSPDGKTVAFRSEQNGGGVYVMDTAGGDERLFAAQGRAPEFSPDGQRIAYWTGDVNESVTSGHIYVSPSGGGPATRLAPDFEDARLPTWSSDGRFLLFRGCRTVGQPLRACMDWWVMSADGTSFFKTGAMAILRQQQITPRDRLGWQGDRVIFDGLQADVNSLWELAISRGDWRAVGKPRRLTTGEGGERGVTLAADNSIAFGRLSSALHIWRLDHASMPSATSLTKLTREAAFDSCPNVSRSGEWLVFGRGSRSRKDIWLQNLRSGRETASVFSEFDKGSPLVDDSGSRIIYEQREPEGSTIWLASGPSRRKLCAGCSNPTGWFGGGEAFFYSGAQSTKILVMDIVGGASRVAVDGRSESVGNADWSPANQHLLFTASPDGSRKQVFAVQFPRATGQPAGKWIPVTSESEWSDWPRWSGDGKTVFYLSNRDGFYCVWGKRFDPDSGEVTGAPFGVAHYHNPRTSPDRVRRGSFAMTVSGDSIFLNLGEVTESVWTAKLAAPHFFGLPRIF